jgi:hypothetical protein
VRPKALIAKRGYAGSLRIDDESQTVIDYLNRHSRVGGNLVLIALLCGNFTLYSRLRGGIYPDMSIATKRHKGHKGKYSEGTPKPGSSIFCVICAFCG